jgi:O-methyltransferase
MGGLWRSGARAIARLPFRAARKVIRLLLPAPLPQPPKLREDLMYWTEELDFREAYETGARRCGEGPRDRYYVMKELLLSLGRLDADTAECGIFKGLSSFLICRYAAGMPRGESYRHHCFDSFEGLSVPSAADAPRSDVRPWFEGDMRGTLDEVKRNLADSPAAASIFHVGWIPQCFEDARDLTFAFVHIDVDLYEPTRDAIAFFYPRLIPGGVIVCDDDGFVMCPGARRAIDEFIERCRVRVVRLPTGQAFLIRRPY